MLERKEINSVGDEHRTTATPATEMTWCNNSSAAGDQIIPSGDNDAAVTSKSDHKIRTVTCPSCGHSIQLENQKGIHDLPGLPAGVKFDPSDQEILEHLEAKSLSDTRKLHPLIDEFIPTIEGENGICYTHPEKLPGVNKDGQVRHFFHRPSRAYTTGTRKRRKVHTDADGGETRWHKTGKTRAVFGEGNLRGYKKILVLYTNYGRQRKPEKTNWVMHQYHLGHDEEEKDGELVVSKVFYQTQPRQCGSSSSSNTKQPLNKMSVTSLSRPRDNNNNFVEYYNPSFISSYHVGSQNPDTQPHHQLIPTLVVHGDTSSFINLSSNSSKDK